MACIMARNNGIHTSSGSKATEACGGLINRSYLARGARVMLTTNFPGQGKVGGLFNVALGIVIDILYAPGLNPATNRDALPLSVMVEFPHFTGPAYIDSMPTVAPSPAVSRLAHCSCGCTRQQTPLRLAWEGTIHKAQGQTVGIGHNIQC